MKKSAKKSFMYDKKALRILSKQTSPKNLDFSLFYEHSLYRKAEIILAYHALPYEIQTENLLQAILRDQKELYLPKVLGHSLSFHKISTLPQDLIVGSFGIMEPRSSLPVWSYDLSKPTLLLAPALACTQDGYRLGHGYGYYDRFLVEYSKLESFITLCLVDPSFDALVFPKDSHDIPFDYIFTGNTLRQCREDKRKISD